MSRMPPTVITTAGRWLSAALRANILVLSVAMGSFGQGQQPGTQQQLVIQDPIQLVGKKINVQRLPLCEPGTYKGDFEHAGMVATVISEQPSKMVPTLSKTVLDRVPPNLRDTMLDEQKAALLLLQFEDGIKRDTCAAIGPKRLAGYIQLAPGETLVPAPGAAAAATVAAAQQVTQPPDELSDDEVNSALRGEGRNHWVSIQDMGLMAAQGNQTPSITLYMPEAVLAIRAESAKKQFTRYEPEEEDKRRSLMIVAEGYAGKTITEGCTSITRVVLLSDPSGRVVQDAYLSEPLAETWRNNFGATNQCQSLRAKFSLADVRKVQAAAPNGEFFVAVFAGSINTKMYKIKRKHQPKLDLR